MSRYLGTVKILNSYVNFMPFYSLDYGTFTRLTNSERYNLFPDSVIPNINIYSSREDRMSFADRFNESQLYIVDLKPELFEDNLNYNGEYNRTRYKINLDNLDSSQYGSIDAFGYYYYLSVSETLGDFSKAYRAIENSLIQNGFKVVIEAADRSCVAGPFSVYQRQDGERVVVTHVKDNHTNDLHIISIIKTTNEENELQNVSIDDTRNYTIFYAGKKATSFIDVISDEDLIKEFKESISSKVANNGSISLKDIDSIVNSYKTSSHIGVPKDIISSRADRLKAILTAEKDLNEQSEAVSQLIADILVNNRKSDALTPVFQKLSENVEFMNSFPQIKVLSTKIQRIEDEIEVKNQELQAIEERLEAKKNEELEERLNKEYEELNSKISSAKDELGGLEDKISELKGSMSNQEYLDHLKDEVSYYERANTERKIESEKIEQNIDSIFNERTEKALNLTFDGMISQKMIQAAAAWETDRQNRQYDAIVGAIAKKELAPMSQVDLVNYLCSTVGSYRPNYDKNTILNLFVCLAQGFLTVFSGPPGAGKTSICNILAHTLGLLLPSRYIDSDNTVNPNRYIDVSVERGWTSKRDFIGYYNPLTKKFDRNNSRLFDALNILNIEATEKKTNRAFIILLDEANLSPMEYYWADFMNACDDLSENSAIDLGEDYRFIIPDELRFIATINNDHTTESLSPRLIDRAWVIRLPNAQPGLGKTTKLSPDDNKEILWSDFLSVFGADNEEISGTAKEIYEGFITKSRKVGIRVSPRSDSAIRRYWSVASKVMVKDESVMVDPSIIALDYAIAQKILPQISGSGDSVEEGLKDLKTFAQDKNLNMTASLLDDIITRGENTMHFFQYFG